MLPWLNRKIGQSPSRRGMMSSRSPADQLLIDQLQAQLAAVGRELAETREYLARAPSEPALIFAEYERSLYYWRSKVLEQELYGPPNPTPTPPHEIPADLLDRFTMGGQVAIEPRYYDFTYPDNYPLIYTDGEIDAYIERIKSGKTYVYGTLDHWVNEALKKYPVTDKQIVNMGSRTPWYEAMILLNGGSPVTIDYNRIISKTPRVKTLTIAEYDANPISFDYGLSISSFEHDGLGMYGDPLDPDGDLKAMQKMKRIINPGGLLLLAVPTGRDKILFNNARVYGRLRLPKLCEGWERIDSWGYEDSTLDGDGSAQPLYALVNQ